MDKFPERCRIAVPPGVGDVYWCLTKLADFRKKHNIKHLTLCVQTTDLTRALDWPKITQGLVDHAEEFKYRLTPGYSINTSGFYKLPGVDCVMWPNAVVDKGIHLSRWIPQYATDLNIPMNVPQPPDPGIVVYASSDGVNKNWLPKCGPSFWSDLLNSLHRTTGKPATLIGAGWDANYARQLNAPYIDQIGKTTLSEVAGIIKHAKLVIGIISGMTILGNHFGTPTVALYPDLKFPPGFPTAWCRTGIPYTALPVSTIVSSKQLINAGLALLAR